MNTPIASAAPRWFRFRLTTAVAMMFLASGLLWLNIRTVESAGGPIPPQIHALFHGTISVQFDHEPVDSALDTCINLQPSPIVYDGEFKTTVTLTLNNVKPSEALDAICAQCGLGWGELDESIVVGKPADVAHIRASLENVDKPTLRAKLMRRVTYCSPDGFMAADNAAFLSSISGLKIVSRLTEDGSWQRTSFNYAEKPLRNTLRSLLLIYDADLEVDGEEIAFVPRRPHDLLQNRYHPPQESDWFKHHYARKGWPLKYWESEAVDWDVVNPGSLDYRFIAINAFANGVLLMIFAVVFEAVLRRVSERRAPVS